MFSYFIVDGVVGSLSKIKYLSATTILETHCGEKKKTQ